MIRNSPVELSIHGLVLGKRFLEAQFHISRYDARSRSSRLLIGFQGGSPTFKVPIPRQHCVHLPATSQKACRSMLNVFVAGYLSLTQSFTLTFSFNFLFMTKSKTAAYTWLGKQLNSISCEAHTTMLFVTQSLGDHC